MELYILSKQDLSILSICKLADYQINLDEETNAKSTFTLMKTNGLKKGNYMTLNGLYRQFIFVIDDVQTEKESDVVTVTALDISNVFNRKVIEKNIDTMKSKSIEEFLANTISENFVNSNDTALNVNYIEIYWHTNTQGNVATNAENGLYNFHTFLTNCRQYKNIYTDFKLENLGKPQTVEGKRISVEAKNRKIVDISLHGESTQNGTPTPDSPIEIENIEGKNKLPLPEKENENFRGATISIKEGVITLDGTTTSSGNYIMPSFQVEETGNYCFSRELSQTTTGIWVLLDESTDNSTWTNIIDWGFSELSKRAVVNLSTEKYYRIRISTNAENTFDNLTIKLQLEEGTVATSYVPYHSLELKVTNGLEETDENYQEQVATFPLSEGQKLMEGSYLTNNGIHHVRKQVVLTGTENWNLYLNKTKTFKLSISPWSYSGVCTHYQGIISSFFDVKAGIYLSGSAMVIISDPRFSTVEEFKTYLAEQYSAGTPVTFEYIMMTNNSKIVEKIVPYTETQQEAWNKIKNLTLFEGLNHISSDANMVLKYYPLEPVGLKFVLKIDIENKQETTELIDTTLPEVTDYNKIYEEDVTAKVQVYIREDGSEYNLYLKTDRTTTTNKDDPDRASGKIEVISVETADKAEEEALNVMKGNNYKHLVEFKITKTSKLMDITKLHIRKTYKNQNRRRYI